MEISSVSNVLFKLINFFFLVGIIGYLLKKKMYPPIQQALIAKEQEKQHFYTQVDILIQERKNLEQVFQQEQQEEEMLKQKAAFWAAQVNLLIANRHASKEERVVVLQNKERVKQEGQELVRLRQDLIPSIKRQAQKILEQKFAHSDKAELYISQIVSYLDKERMSLS